VNIVLVEPLIPQNTGSVGRTCVATGATLHLVEPLGFDIDERAVRRAGLDYWKDVDLRVHADWAACQAALGLPEDRIWYLSARATRPYTTARFRPGDALVFGRETTGLGDELVEALGDRVLAVPAPGPVRSLNLATSVGIVLYEALRQCRPDLLPPPEDRT
jgi:tRNA (cytidine/uridine-2'-O-)-methyltransferase